MHSSTPVRSISTSQTSSVTNALISKPTSRSISPTVMTEQKQKGFCFWCRAKYHVGHKCVKPQLYQFLPEPMSDSEVKEFHEYSNQLEEVIPEDSPSKSHIISLHAITGSQGHNTIYKNESSKTNCRGTDPSRSPEGVGGQDFLDIVGYSEAREREFPLVQ
ncbi:hypothetical protein Godav_027877 [Gossypium davidsonii]|uniref:Uncharacterized protein n=2 Tax=Gossypium TaxID=3633 RepID=A0A7J8RYX9_GOSDV|nr:hypothetical protein [Gossypium davidsonii]MBA0653925.1 hypothetical protein [Gossypium klotzschianum]